AAASAALGEPLTAPEDLGGSERSAVLRCGRQGGGTVVVKTYPDSQEGRTSFAAEAAALALTGTSGRPASGPPGRPLASGPSLLATSTRGRLIVMTDLGIGQSLADMLLGDHAGAAEAALLSWARACGELAVACAGREADLARLLAGYRTGQDGAAGGHWLPRRIRQIP